jgi:hypothetical protein
MLDVFIAVAFLVIVLAPSMVAMRVLHHGFDDDDLN